VTTPLNYDRGEKLHILTTVYNQLHDVRRDYERMENKVSFSVSALFLAVTTYIIKGDFKPDISIRLSLAVFVIVITILSLWYLLGNSRNIRGTCRLIVKAEALLGLYENDQFYEPSGGDLPDKREESISSNGFFEERMKAWGQNDRWLSLTPHLIAVMFSCLVSTIVIFLN